MARKGARVEERDRNQAAQRQARALAQFATEILSG
jgi:hypothetical protein